MTLYTHILSSGDMHIFRRIFSRYMGKSTKKERGGQGDLYVRGTLCFKVIYGKNVRVEVYI